MIPQIDFKNWIPVSLILPCDNRVVMTKIDDSKGIRNECELKLIRGLWYFPNGSMYVYYNPTHWKPLAWKWR
jgi:hypothetical protein